MPFAYTGLKKHFTIMPPSAHGTQMGNIIPILYMGKSRHIILEHSSNFDRKKEETIKDEGTRVIYLPSSKSIIFKDQVT